MIKLGLVTKLYILSTYYKNSNEYSIGKTNTKLDFLCIVGSSLMLNNMHTIEKTVNSIVKCIFLGKRRLNLL